MLNTKVPLSYFPGSTWGSAYIVAAEMDGQGKILTSLLDLVYIRTNNSSLILRILLLTKNTQNIFGELTNINEKASHIHIKVNKLLNK